MENNLDFAPPNGETIRDTSARLARIVQRVKRDHMEENVLLVGHGGSLRAGIVSLLELPLEANWKFAMHNCSLTVHQHLPRQLRHAPLQRHVAHHRRGAGRGTGEGAGSICHRSEG